MDERVKKLWLKALRSGEYQQGKGQLKRGRKEPRHCCLGVLCELAKRERVIRPYDGGDGFPPDLVVRWAGLENRNPTLGRRSNSATAAALNDRGETFEYIATRIEKSL